MVTVGHMFMGCATLLHMMDVATRFSAAYVVISTALDEAIIGFESCWLALFWSPSSIQGDRASEKPQVIEFVQQMLAGTFRPVPPRLHQKNR